MTYENFTTTLTINNCVVEDQSEYTIRLMNEFGISELTIQVLIDYELPRFEQPLQDTTATLDSTAVFECRVAGRPEPETKWHIFGVELTDREKYYFEKTEAVHRMYIRNVTMDDCQMSYTVRAFNTAGFVESSANIILQGSLRVSPLPQLFNIVHPHYLHFLRQAGLLVPWLQIFKSWIF